VTDASPDTVLIVILDRKSKIGELCKL